MFTCLFIWGLKGLYRPNIRIRNDLVYVLSILNYYKTFEIQLLRLLFRLLNRSYINVLTYAEFTKRVRYLDVLKWKQLKKRAFFQHLTKAIQAKLCDSDTWNIFLVRCSAHLPTDIVYLSEYAMKRKTLPAPFVMIEPY